MLRRQLLAALVAAATVGPAAAGSVVLTWAEVLQNTDGTPITDLAGYRVRWGCATAGDYPNERTILYPGLRSLYIGALPSTGTCYFTLHALNTGRVEISGVPLQTSIESAPAIPAQKAMNAAEPVKPYTRSVDWVAGTGVAPLEVRQAARLIVGFVGDPLVIRTNATSNPTRAELRATFVQSGEKLLSSWAGAQGTWAAPFAGLWELEVRSCNGPAASTCGDWRNAREDNSVFLFKLKAPQGGGIDP